LLTLREEEEGGRERVMISEDILDILISSSSSTDTSLVKF